MSAICWDQWFPEAARAMVLQGAEILLYPTAIGSEPQDAELDSREHWKRVMQGHAGANVVSSAQRHASPSLLFFFPVFLAFPLFFGLVLFWLPSARVLGLSWVLGLFVVFWEDCSGFLVGFGGFVWVEVFSGLVWVFNGGFFCILGFGFLVGFAWVGSVLRHLFLIYSGCTRGALCCYL
jgi:hypothetical protein